MEKVMLTIKKHNTSLHRQWLLLDECDRPIARLRAKNMTTHARWKVFRGMSKADSDMIFSATKKNMFSKHTDVNVSLANKLRHDNCDFEIKGNWKKGKLDIYKRDSSTTKIAEIQKDWDSQENFRVTIYPDVDYAFVAALIAIVDGMESPSKMAVAALAVGQIVGVGAFNAVICCA
ncbi:protein LURP-one-related 15-like [Bidens hawaiensis]|uniref:protein LURP-one-related 15-like n=1 Tax=Bidens hawaiensis TaxID=980011 RepID=UPI00404A0411